MGHKRVTVQQRLLWDWRMEMEREACEETTATKRRSIRKIRLLHKLYREYLKNLFVYLCS